MPRAEEVLAADCLDRMPVPPNQPTAGCSLARRWQEGPRTRRALLPRSSSEPPRQGCCKRQCDRQAAGKAEPKGRGRPARRWREDR
jgi:hypothetical protein